ncbi:MAG: His-Xaa-Ser system radical SAM maturase HxsC [Nitrosospira sp.]|nr:His-Xaa-Ser system radical SAM maturase HxsC [Nitrosospira sp.]
MLQLAGKFDDLVIRHLSEVARRQYFRVSTNPNLPGPLARHSAFLYVADDVIPAGFALYLSIGSPPQGLGKVPDAAAIGRLPASAEYLTDGDIIRITPMARSYRVVFRKQARHHAFLLTERCNHYCLMCSQPPHEQQDDWLMDEAEHLIPLLPADTETLGFTGGEPTLYGDRLINLLRLSDRWLPRTAVHLLSNGRKFSDRGYAENYAGIGHHDLMVGIPIYSDDPSQHNYVVQADGAFDETIEGVLNLKRLHQRVEIRVVVHAQTVDRLPKLAEFIARNLLFVDQVAFMGLEITGFTRGNLKTLWVDPYDYRFVLEEAVEILAAYRIPVRVYNHQLCVVTPRVREFCVKSISDWKNEYLPECARCRLRSSCGGFFSTQVKYRHSEHIFPDL